MSSKDKQIEISARASSSSEIFFSILEQVSKRYMKIFPSEAYKKTPFADDKKCITHITCKIFDVSVKYEDIIETSGLVANPLIDGEIITKPAISSGEDSTSLDVDLGDF